MSHTYKALILFILISIFTLLNSKSFAQVNLEEVCQSMERIEGACQSLSDIECRQLLEECAKYYEEKSAQIKKDITKTEQEKKTLQNQIDILKKKIKNLDYQIYQSNLAIKDLGFQIEDTQSSIDKTSLKIKESRYQLANILQCIYEEDQKSLIEILLSEKELSDFFDDLMALEILNSKNQELLGTIKSLKSSLESEEQLLSEEKEDTERMVKIQTLQKQESAKTKEEQEYFLKMTEAQYQQYLKEKKELEARAAEIMARITQLTLAGMKVPTTPEELYELASWAGKLTGVRPALILGLIEVESALGINVGQCNCAGQPVCRHPELSYKQVMSSKQWDAFLTITQELGLNPNTTPVSCYVSGGQVQMGGAMGPAQFMPNTWLNLGYKQKVENITGIKPANPWLASDAFLAAALYLANFDAGTKSRESEMGAVTAYLCGTSKMTDRCQAAGGKWYRDLVMEKTDKWQKWIDAGL